MSRDASKVTPEKQSASNAPLTRKAIQWERRFLGCCNDEPAASRALERLEKAGLSGASKRLLWEYAEGPRYFAEMQRGTALIVRNIEAFCRAERAEKRRLRDPRAQMFRKRREEASRILARTPWPFRNPTLQTFGDVARACRSPELFNLRKIRGLVGRSKLSYMLVVLWEGAKAHGVLLSGNELAVLAYCASGKELEGSAVRRLLRDSWIGTGELGYRGLFENFVACVH